jgi:hypothetical protein
MTESAELQIDESQIDSQDESQDESTTEAPNRLSENNAVAECLRAWQITIENERAKLDEDDSEDDAEKEANEAFLAAMPPLSGHRNICDFIACVTQAYMWDIIRHQQADHLFAAAKIALSALRLESEPDGSVRRRRRRQRKSPVTEKIG